MKFRLRLVGRTASGGVATPYPKITLRVRDKYGGAVHVRFQIDPGADCTAMPMSLAKREGIPFQQVQESSAGGLVGTARKYRDRLRVVLGGKEHVWPCDFVDVAAGNTLAPNMPQALLGRAGFLDEYAVAIDAGFVIITRLGPIRRAWRRGLHWFWGVTGRIASPESPL